MYCNYHSFLKQFCKKPFSAEILSSKAVSDRDIRSALDLPPSVINSFYCYSVAKNSIFDCDTNSDTMFVQKLAEKIFEFPGHAHVSSVCERCGSPKLRRNFLFDKGKINEVFSTATELLQRCGQIVPSKKLDQGSELSQIHPEALDIKNVATRKQLANRNCEESLEGLNKIALNKSVTIEKDVGSSPTLLNHSVKNTNNLGDPKHVQSSDTNHESKPVVDSLSMEKSGHKFDSKLIENAKDAIFRDESNAVQKVVFCSNRKKDKNTALCGCHEYTYRSEILDYNPVCILESAFISIYDLNLLKNIIVVRDIFLSFVKKPLWQHVALLSTFIAQTTFLSLYSSVIHAAADYLDTIKLEILFDTSDPDLNVRLDFLELTLSFVASFFEQSARLRNHCDIVDRSCFWSHIGKLAETDIIKQKLADLLKHDDSCKQCFTSYDAAADNFSANLPHECFDFLQTLKIVSDAGTELGGMKCNGGFLSRLNVSLRKFYREIYSLLIDSDTPTQDVLIIFQFLVSTLILTEEPATIIRMMDIFLMERRFMITESHFAKIICMIIEYVDLRQNQHIGRFLLENILNKYSITDFTDPERTEIIRKLHIFTSGLSDEERVSSARRAYSKIEVSIRIAFNQSLKLKSGQKSVNKKKRTSDKNQNKRPMDGNPQIKQRNGEGVSENMSETSDSDSKHASRVKLLNVILEYLSYFTNSFFHIEIQNIFTECVIYKDTLPYFANFMSINNCIIPWISAKKIGDATAIVEFYSTFFRKIQINYNQNIRFLQEVAQKREVESMSCSKLLEKNVKSWEIPWIDLNELEPFVYFLFLPIMRKGCRMSENIFVFLMEVLQTASLRSFDVNNRLDTMNQVVCVCDTILHLFDKNPKIFHINTTNVTNDSDTQCASIERIRNFILEAFNVNISQIILFTLNTTVCISSKYASFCVQNAPESEALVFWRNLVSKIVLFYNQVYKDSIHENSESLQSREIDSSYCSAISYPLLGNSRFFAKKIRDVDSVRLLHPEFEPNDPPYWQNRGWGYGAKAHCSTQVSKENMLSDILERHVIDFCEFFLHQPRIEFWPIMNMVPRLPSKKEYFYIYFQLWMYLLNNNLYQNSTFFCLKTPALIDFCSYTPDQLFFDKGVFLELMRHLEYHCEKIKKGFHAMRVRERSLNMVLSQSLYIADSLFLCNECKKRYSLLSVDNTQVLETFNIYDFLTQTLQVLENPAETTKLLRLTHQHFTEKNCDLSQKAENVAATNCVNSVKEHSTNAESSHLINGMNIGETSSYICLSCFKPKIENSEIERLSLDWEMYDERTKYLGKDFKEYDVKRYEEFRQIISPRNIKNKFQTQIQLVILYAEIHKVNNFNFSGILEYIQDPALLGNPDIHLSDILKIIHFSVKNTGDYFKRYILELLKLYSDAFETTKKHILQIVSCLMTEDPTVAYDIEIHVAFNDLIQSEASKGVILNDNQIFQDLKTKYKHYFLDFTQKNAPFLYEYLIYHICDLSLLDCIFIQYQGRFKEKVSKSAEIFCFIHNVRNILSFPCNIFSDSVCPHFGILNPCNEKSFASIFQHSSVKVKPITCNATDESQRISPIFGRTSLAQKSADMNQNVPKPPKKDISDNIRPLMGQKSVPDSVKCDETGPNRAILFHPRFLRKVRETVRREMFDPYFDTECLVDAFLINKNSLETRFAILYFLTKRLERFFNYHDLHILVRIYDILDIRDLIYAKFVPESLSKGLDFRSKLVDASSLPLFRSLGIYKYFYSCFAHGKKLRDFLKTCSLKKYRSKNAMLSKRRNESLLNQNLRVNDSEKTFQKGMYNHRINPENANNTFISNESPLTATNESLLNQNLRVNDSEKTFQKGMYNHRINPENANNIFMNNESPLTGTNESLLNQNLRVNDSEKTFQKGMYNTRINPENANNTFMNNESPLTGTNESLDAISTADIHSNISAVSRETVSRQKSDHYVLKYNLNAITAEMDAHFIDVCDEDSEEVFKCFFCEALWCNQDFCMNKENGCRLDSELTKVMLHFKNIRANSFSSPLTVNDTASNNMEHSNHLAVVQKRDVLKICPEITYMDCKNDAFTTFVDTSSRNELTLSDLEGISTYTSGFFKFYFRNLLSIISGDHKQEHKLPTKPSMYNDISQSHLIKIHNIFFTQFTQELVRSRCTRFEEHLSLYIDLRALTVIDIVIILQTSKKKQVLTCALESLKNKDILFYVPQIVQCLTIPTIFTEASVLLLDLCTNKALSHSLIWALRAYKNLDKTAFQKLIRDLENSGIFKDIHTKDALRKNCKKQALNSKNSPNFDPTTFQNKNDNTQLGESQDLSDKERKFCHDNTDPESYEFKKQPHFTECENSGNVGVRNYESNQSSKQKHGVEVTGSREYRSICLEDKDDFMSTIKFFDSLTDISALMIDFRTLTKDKKTAKINHLLSKIKLDGLVYLPTDPEYEIISIVPGSAVSLQSYAKVPYLLSFYCVSNTHLCSSEYVKKIQAFAKQTIFKGKNNLRSNPQQNSSPAHLNESMLDYCIHENSHSTGRENSEKIERNNVKLQVEDKRDQLTDYLSNDAFVHNTNKPKIEDRKDQLTDCLSNDAFMHNNVKLQVEDKRDQLTDYMSNDAFVHNTNKPQVEDKRDQLTDYLSNDAFVHNNNKPQVEDGRDQLTDYLSNDAFMHNNNKPQVEDKHENLPELNKDSCDPLNAHYSKKDRDTGKNSFQNPETTNIHQEKPYEKKSLKKQADILREGMQSQVENHYLQQTALNYNPPDCRKSRDNHHEKEDTKLLEALKSVDNESKSEIELETNFKIPEGVETAILHAEDQEIVDSYSAEDTDSTETEINNKIQSMKLLRKIVASEHGKKEFLRDFDVTKKRLIIKAGDDCRQDMLALQLISLFKTIFQNCNLDLFLYPYKVIATSDSTGIIEVVPDAMTRDEIGKERINNLSEYFQFRYGYRETKRHKQAIYNFTRSFAGYSLVVYFLSIKDRHNANIMITDDAHIVHIDFGFMFESKPRVNTEHPIKLTDEIYVLLHENNVYGYFEDLVVKGFLALRQNAKEIIYLVDSFKNSGLPCFSPNTVKNLTARFKLNLSDSSAREYIISVVKKGIHGIGNWVYDKYQNLANNIAH